MDDYLERAESVLSELRSRSRGQPRKTISTQRFVLLARFFQHHTGGPHWDLVEEICDSFEEEALDDAGKRVRRLPQPSAIGQVFWPTRSRCRRWGDYRRGNGRHGSPCRLNRLKGTCLTRKRRLSAKVEQRKS